MARQKCTECGTAKDVKGGFYTMRNGKNSDVCKDCLNLIYKWTYENLDPFYGLLQRLDYPFLFDRWQLIKIGKGPKFAGTEYIRKFELQIDSGGLVPLGFSDSIYQKTDINDVFKMKNPDAKILMRINNPEEYQKMIEETQESDNEQIITMRQKLQELFGIKKKDIGQFFEKIGSVIVVDKESFKPSETEDQLVSYDIEALRIKWGGKFTEDELIRLEDFWQDMIKSYTIETASHKDYLRKICLVSVMAEQELFKGNITQYKSLISTYDTLMKSSKFTEAQNATSQDYISSFGEFVSYIEKDGFIPKFAPEQPMDIVDITINNMNEYTRKLVLGERNLSEMIENIIAKMMQKGEQYEEEIESFIEGTSNEGDDVDG